MSESHPTPPEARRRRLRGLARAQWALGGPNYPDVIAAQVHPAPSRDDLNRAISTLRRRHPVLNLDLRDPMNELTPGTSSAGEVVVAEVALSRDGVVARALAEPLGGGGPAFAVWLARCPNTEEVTLVLAVHHALVDGRSMSALLRDLLAATASDLGPPLPVPPSALELATVSRRARLAIPLLQRVWSWRLRTAGVRFPLPAPELPEGMTPPTHFSSRRLPAPRAAALRAAARKHGTTVGGALAVAARSAAQRLCERRGARRVPPIAVDAMVDVRPLLSDPPEVGMFAGGALAIPAWSLDDLGWHGARRANRRVKTQTERGLPLLIHALADATPDPAEALKALSVNLRRNGGSAAVVGISNVGVWNGPDLPHTRLLGVWSATSAILTGPAMLVWLRTVHGTACLSAIGNATVVTGAEVTRLLLDVEEHLTALETA